MTATEAAAVSTLVTATTPPAGYAALKRPVLVLELVAGEQPHISWRR